MGDLIEGYNCNYFGCIMEEDELLMHQRHQRGSSISVIESEAAHAKHLGFFADRTPTPTRDFWTLNPFDEQFRKASQSRLSEGMLVLTNPESDSLDTPHVLVPVESDETISSTSKDDSHIFPSSSLAARLSPVYSNGVSSTKIMMRTLEGDSNEEGQKLTLNVTSASEGGKSSNVLSTPTPVIMAGPSVTQSLSGIGLPGQLSHDIDILEGERSIEAPIRVPLVSIEPSKTPSPVQSSVAVSDLQSEVKSQCLQQLPSATVLQLLLRLPNGQAIPVNIPATPAVPANVIPSVVPSSNVSVPTESLAKMKLKKVLTANKMSPKSSGGRGPRSCTADRIAEMTRLSSPSFSGSVDESKLDANDMSGSGSIGRVERRRRNSSSDEDPAEKRRKFLERNRVAAIRCREKKKKFVESLAAKSDELSHLNQKLQNEVNILRDEVSKLKLMLLKHKDCPVTLALQEDAGICFLDGDTSGTSPVKAKCHDLQNTMRLPPGVSLSPLENKPRTRSHSMPSIANGSYSNSANTGSFSYFTSDRVGLSNSGSKLPISLVSSSSSVVASSGAEIIHTKLIHSNVADVQRSSGTNKVLIEGSAHTSSTSKSVAAINPSGHRLVSNCSYQQIRASGEVRIIPGDNIIILGDTREALRGPVVVQSNVSTAERKTD